MSPPHARPYVHLVGSVPLADAQQVFRAVCARLGPRLRRLPDGETGERANWIRCILAMLAAHPAMEIDPATPPLQWRQWDGVLLREILLVRFREGIDPGRVTFELPYAEAAIDSCRASGRAGGGHRHRMRLGAQEPGAARSSVRIAYP